MGRLARDVSPVVRLELVDRVVLGGDMGVKAARALAEGLKLKSLEELLGVVCIHTTLTPAILILAATRCPKWNISAATISRITSMVE